MAGFGWSHPKQTAGADPPPTGHPSRGARPVPPPLSPAPCRWAAKCVAHIPPRAPRREGFSEILQKNGHLAYTGLATWQWVRPPPPDNLQPRRGKQPTKTMEITTKIQGGKR